MSFMHYHLGFFDHEKAASSARTTRFEDKYISHPSDSVRL